MARYQVTAPDGRTVVLEGDAPPTEQDLEGIFKGLPAQAASGPDSIPSGVSGPDRGMKNFRTGLSDERRNPVDAVEQLINYRLPRAVPTDPVAAAAQKQYLDDEAKILGSAATAVRYGGPLLQPLGGPTGALAAGGSEGLAQLIEGDVKPGEIAKSAAIGGVPLSKAKGIMAAIGDTLKMGGTAAIGEQARSLIDEGKLSDRALTDAALVGGGTGVAQGIGKVVGGSIGRVSPEEAARVASARLNNANADASLAAMRPSGAVVVPSSVNPSIKNRVLESIAGIQNVEAGVARKNQPIFNEMGRREAGIPLDSPITEQSLEAARAAIGKDSYDAARKAGFGDLLNDWRDASTKLKKAQKDLDRGFTNARGAAVDDAAKAVQDASDAMDKAATTPDTMKVLQEAKKAFGKNYDVEQAVLSGTDNVRPAVLSQMLEKRGERGLTGELADIARFHNNFDRSTKNPAKMATAPGAASAGTGLIAGGGNPAAAAALVGGLPVARGVIRDMLVSPAYQAKNAVRDYTPRKSLDPVTAETITRIIALLAARNREEAQ